MLGGAAVERRTSRFLRDTRGDLGLSQIGNEFDCGKAPLQEIRRDAESVVAVGRALEVPTADHLDVVLAHQAARLTLAEADDWLVQCLVVTTRWRR